MDGAWGSSAVVMVCVVTSVAAQVPLLQAIGDVSWQLGTWHVGRAGGSKVRVQRMEDVIMTHLEFVLLPVTVSKQVSLFLNKAFTNHHHPLLQVLG